MAHHAGAHKTTRKQTVHAAAIKRESENEDHHEEKTKLAAVGLLFSGDGQIADDNEFGSPRPSHLHKDGIGEQPMTLQVPQNIIHPGAAKIKHDENTKKGKKNSKDDKAKDGKHHKDFITMEEIEATLERKHYAEDDIDLEQLRAKLREEEQEKCHEWIDNTIDRMLHNTAVLTLICALMTAFACYIFVQLPYYLYSYHILRETFLASDSLMEQNGYSRGFGLRYVSPLPVVIVCMYLVVLYFIYLINYPKETKLVHYGRVCLFFTLEMYLIACIISYLLDAGNVGVRLNNFFEMDKKGIKGIPWDKGTEKLKFLDRSQEYFGCCGYRNMTEWSKIHAANYSNSWPLSCCDEKTSTIACYPPVEKTVVFFRRPLDEDEFVRYETKRLYEEPCYPKERILVLVVIMLITFSTVIFVVLSTWNAVIFLKLSHLVLSKDLEIRHRSQYADFF